MNLTATELAKAYIKIGTAYSGLGEAARITGTAISNLNKVLRKLPVEDDSDKITWEICGIVIFTVSIEILYFLLKWGWL